MLREQIPADIFRVFMLPGLAMIERNSDRIPPWLS
jgi:hypothetical protein